MPVRGTGENDKPWSVSLRWLPEIPVKRAELRMTATYRVAPGAFVGLEYNPLDDDLGLLVNWRLVEETATRPMLMVGTSSDRIGTPDGRAYYATIAKDLNGLIGVPVAPYVGTAYGEFDDDWEFIAGVGIRWSEELRSTHTWDGHNLHHLLDWYGVQDLRLGALVAQQDNDYYAGISLGFGL